VVETILYSLWDLGLKVGQSTRSLDDMVRQAKGDVTVRTALLEGRYVWGDQDLYDEASRRFKAEVQSSTERTFISEKLAERDARHKRWAIRATWSSRTSRKAKGDCATSTRSSDRQIRLQRPDCGGAG